MALVQLAEVFWLAVGFVQDTVVDRVEGALVPPGANPKDLFGRLTASAAARDALASVIVALRDTQAA